MTSWKGVWDTETSEGAKEQSDKGTEDSTEEAQGTE